MRGRLPLIRFGASLPRHDARDDCPVLRDHLLELDALALSPRAASHYFRETDHLPSIQSKHRTEAQHTGPEPPTTGTLLRTSSRTVNWHAGSPVKRSLYVLGLRLAAG